MSNWNPSDVFKTQVDDLVEFKYNGGSHPGSNRVIRVRSVDSHSLAGVDVFADEDNSYRKFDFSKIYEFKVLRRQPVVENTAVYDANRGVVLTKKNGDSLSISINPNTIALSSHKSGTTSSSDKHVVVPLPCKNDKLFDALFDVISSVVK